MVVHDQRSPANSIKLGAQMAIEKIKDTIQTTEKSLDKL